MCSIIASFSAEKFKELYTLNAYRGTLTSSFTVLDEDSEVVTLNRFDDPDKMFKVIESSIFDGDTGCYFVGHSQAPTTANSGIHPAEEGAALLWHNGIVKESDITAWNTRLNTNFVWDTELILHLYNLYGFSILSSIDGSFACIMHEHNNLFVFRNALAPLFYDKQLNISSTKFVGAKPLPADTVFKINIHTREITDWNIPFITKNNPYSI